ncbi:MAG: DUF1501 domain-containing protein [Planctomycetaceae bacterium]
MGGWVSYGLGSPNKDLQTFVVLHSTNPRWSSDSGVVLPALGQRLYVDSPCRRHSFRSSGDPVLYLSNPSGVDAATRRRMLDGLAELNTDRQRGPVIRKLLRPISQYEMAFRMQTSVPNPDGHLR